METKECSPERMCEPRMYDNSPSRMSYDGSPNCSFTLRRISSDILQDNSTQDSGYSPSEPKVSPRRHLSFGSMSEEFIDLSDIENDTENQPPNKQLTGEFSKLITGSISDALNTSSPKCSFNRPPLRRPFSVIGTINTPGKSRARSLFGDLEKAESRSFKRPEPPTGLVSPLSAKRFKVFDRPVRRVEATTIFKRSVSTQEMIKTAIHRSSTEPDLIGDYTKAFSLPLIPGRHQDLKSITPTTVAKLINGEYADIASFKIIDCRYPYEYEGGHIVGAKNLYTKEQILTELLQLNKPEDLVQEENKRHILIFHCEFSSERAPNLSRFLRNSDRRENKDFFPYLTFPEVYLLDGGYKNFFETHGELCSPHGYLPMLHPDHEQNLKHFRAKSKTFNSDIKASKSKRMDS
ncbi:M-phase inducer phosphatase-like isoform X2 [Atheta coriaria]